MQQAASQKEDSAVTIQSNDVNAANKMETNKESLPAISPIKKPSGIYHALLPLENKIEQTIVFNNDFTYHLEEKYPDIKDSIVITEGTWMPSDGFIWLYKDQVERGRYKWHADTLQYFSPALKKKFSMQQAHDALQNDSLQFKRKRGVMVYGFSKQPLWSIEYNNKDTLSFLLAEWKHPLKEKVKSTFNTTDSIGYIAGNDSAEIRLTVFPYFCNDGRNHWMYRNQIKVQYHQQIYNGCGIIYK